MKKIGRVFAFYNLGKIKVIAVMAFLSALSVVAGKFLAIPVGEYMRFSFENLPILLSGIIFGPVCGMITGVVADLVGCIMAGYAINPIITAGAATIGLLSGLVYRTLPSGNRFLPLSATVVIAHFFGSVVVKTIGLSIYFGLPFKFTFMWRSLNYLIVGIAELAILYILINHSGFKKQISSVTGEKI